MIRRIFLDYASTTPVDKRVEKAMRPFLTEKFGNPSSLSAEGIEAKKALEDVRLRMAALLSSQPDEIIFTSGATEANNLAIYGVINSITQNSQHRVLTKIHVITSVIEHHSVLFPFKQLEKGGVAVTYLPVDKNGFVDLDELKKALRPAPAEASGPETVLVSIMYANNEIGTIQPLAEIAKIIRQFRKIKGRPLTPPKVDPWGYPLFHTDAAQAPGFLPLNVLKLHVDLMSLGAHKFYGPKGAGVLFRRRGLALAPLFYGGGQEFDLRSGTEPLTGAVGTALALELVEKNREKESARLSGLRDYFIDKLLKIPGAILNGVKHSVFKDAQHRVLEALPSIINVSFPGVEGEWVVIGLDAKGVSASTGSACTTAEVEPSHVIMALERNEARALSAVRFTLGKSTTKRDLDYVLKILPGILEKGKRI